MNFRSSIVDFLKMLCNYPRCAGNRPVAHTTGSWIKRNVFNHFIDNPLGEREGNGELKLVGELKPVKVDRVYPFSPGGTKESPRLPMPEVIYYVAMSLDGYIATPDGGVDWLAPFQSGEEDYGYAASYASVDALLIGSQTYAQFLSFGSWPYKGKPCWLFSRRVLDAAYAEVILTDREPEGVFWLQSTNAAWRGHGWSAKRR